MTQSLLVHIPGHTTALAFSRLYDSGVSEANWKGYSNERQPNQHVMVQIDNLASRFSSSSAKTQGMGQELRLFLGGIV